MAGFLSKKRAYRKRTSLKKAVCFVLLIILAIGFAIYTSFMLIEDVSNVYVAIFVFSVPVIVLTVLLM